MVYATRICLHLTSEIVMPVFQDVPQIVFQSHYIVIVRLSLLPGMRAGEARGMRKWDALLSSLPDTAMHHTRPTPKGAVEGVMLSPEATAGRVRQIPLSLPLVQRHHNSNLPLRLDRCWVSGRHQNENHMLLYWSAIMPG